MTEQVKKTSGKPARHKFKGPGPGRPKGVPNKATVEGKEFCRAFIFGTGEHEGNGYLPLLLRRVMAGRAPHIEKFIWEHALGKPKETHEHTGRDGGPIQFQEMTDEEIERRLRAIGYNRIAEQPGN